MPPKRQRDKTMKEVIRREEENRCRLSSSSQNQTNISSAGETSRVIRGRGLARGTPIWGTGQKLHVDFNSQWQPIGPNKNMFTTQLGLLAKNSNIVPLTCVCWTDMPTSSLDAIWKEVKDNTDVPDEYRPHLMKEIAKAWRDWKARVKKDYYKKFATDQERLALTPPRVNEEQWKTLVAYWGIEEVQAAAENNKRNRAKQGSLHRTGRTSFAVLREKMAENGEDTDRISVFIKTRSRSDGEIPDSETADIISQFNANLDPIPHEEQTSQIREEIWKKVMGPDHGGYARTYGHGPSPTDISRASSSQHHKRMEEKLESVMRENQGLREQYANLQEDHIELRNRFDSVFSFLQQNFPSFANGTVQPRGHQIPDASSGHQDFFAGREE